MSINITLLNENTPQIYIQFSGQQLSGEPLTEQQLKTDELRFTHLSSIIHTGITSLGHSDFFPADHLIHVFLIRTHWVGDLDRPEPIDKEEADKLKTKNPEAYSAFG